MDTILEREDKINFLTDKKLKENFQKIEKPILKTPYLESELHTFNTHIQNINLDTKNPNSEIKNISGFTSLGVPFHEKITQKLLLPKPSIKHKEFDLAKIESTINQYR